MYNLCNYHNWQTLNSMSNSTFKINSWQCPTISTKPASYISALTLPMLNYTYNNVAFNNVGCWANLFKRAVTDQTFCEVKTCIFFHKTTKISWVNTFLTANGSSTQKQHHRHLRRRPIILIIALESFRSIKRHNTRFPHYLK